MITGLCSHRPPSIYMTYTLTTLTAAEHNFKYLIRVARMLEFHNIRQWLSQTYGLAEQMDRDTINNPHWGFEIRMGSNTVYLRDDEELGWFKIKYGNPAL